MKLSWVAPCAADAYIISRCTGSGCSSFAQIAAAGAGTGFIDGSPDLKWNTDYTYRVIAKYTIQGDSAPTTSTGNTGDVECESQFTDDSFCLSSFYYGSMKSYLQTYGYSGSPATPASSFMSGFDAAVDKAFSTKYNKGASCDAKNKLTLSLTCGFGSLCVAKGTTPSCITPTSCDLTTGIFGLGSSVSSCEGTESDPKYCFFDKSATSVDACYTCSQSLSCYDYKSKSSCERNNCFVGACEWRDTYSDIGAGVCIDARYNSCPLCNKSSNPTAPNANAYNAVFDQCSPEKSAAVSTPKYPCFFSNGLALDCSKASCKDYTPAQCGSPAGGVTLSSDNSLASVSTDPCGIKVCQFDASPTIQCRKNADGTPVSDYWPDCALNDTSCERDYFTPATTIIPVGSAGKYDYLNIRIWEKSNGSDFGHLAMPPGDFTLFIGAPNMTTGDRKELPGFKTYFCAGKPEDALCTSFVSVNSTQLNVNDLALQDGTKLLLNLSPGWNRLRFYSRDPANNLEVIKNITLFACTACQGPKVLSYNITPGREINGTYYTNSLIPTASVSYNEPAEQVFAGYVKGTETIEIPKTPGSGFNYAYLFGIPTPALAEGAYLFSLNSRDTNNVFMGAPLSVPLVVDTTPPVATYTPADGFISGTGTVVVTINFSEPIVVSNFTITEFVVYNTSVGPVRAPVTRDITKLFVGSKNRTFTATLSLSEGKKIITPIITDYAGNKLSTATASSSFVINALPPLVTILEPQYGVSSKFTFPLTFETDSVAECRYWSSQTIPPPSSFSSLVPFDGSFGFTHTKSSFSEIKTEATPFKFFVSCKDEDTGMGSANFWLSVDTTKLKIIKAFASPSIIVQTPLQTVLKVQTDDLSVCKYSPTATDYDSMEGTFPSFGIMGLTSHAVNVTVPTAASYKYHVACKNVAGLGPVSADIPFSVDLTIPLNVTSVTPVYYGTLSIPLGIETNKDTYCYYSAGGTLKPIGSVNYSSMAHTTTVVVPTIGWHSIPVFCSTGAGTSYFGIEEKNITVSVFVDLTPPWMLYADDTSNNPEFPQFSYFTNRLRLAFLGADNETNVSRYNYRIEQQLTGVVVKNWTPSVVKDGLPWYVTDLNLTNGLSYYARITAENMAGLQSSELPTDGVTIDITKIPPHCVNSELDANETDIDCGLTCQPCSDYKNCLTNVDCISRICNATKVCQPSRCDDLLLGGNETDVDCGGGSCDTCDIGLACAMHSDCTSNFCNAGLCIDNPCGNGYLDSLESDVDCGGACPTKCKAGQSCTLDADCEEGTCADGVCRSLADEDEDGVPDSRDNCPGTPFGETVDEFGCGASQRHSCGDEIDDAWRIRYFGDVLCEGEASADADPDGDNRQNLKEYREGTDPTISNFKFPWLWLIIILLISGGVGYGIWYNKQHPGELKKRWNDLFSRMTRKQAQTTPVRSAVAQKQGSQIPDWLTVNELKKLGPEDVSAKTFEQLGSFVKGQLPLDEHGKLIKRLEKEQTPLDKLRELALAGLSAKDKKELLLKLQLLRKGKLGKEDMEELFRKLRITSTYYEQHKSDIERELKSYVRGERKRKK